MVFDCCLWQQGLQVSPACMEGYAGDAGNGALMPAWERSVRQGILSIFAKAE